MQVNQFSVTIPEGREVESGHILLAHGTVYRIRIQNHLDRRCDAIVKVDGKEVGGFRLEKARHYTGKDILLLERPAHDTGCFTFYRTESKEGQAVQAGSITPWDRGLIQVLFNPERVPYGIKEQVRSLEREEKTAGGVDYPTHTSFGPEEPQEHYKSRSIGPSSQHTNTSARPTMKNLSSGVTGLSGKSNQNFVNVPDLDYDPSLETTITLRLVADDNPRPLTEVSRGNPTPGMIG